MGLGSEIRDPEKTYPGSRVKKAPDPGIRIRTTVCNMYCLDGAGEPAGHVGGGLRGCGRQQQQRAPPHTTTRPRHKGANHLLLTYLLRSVQCSGSMTFWGGSGSADPCL